MAGAARRVTGKARGKGKSAAEWRSSGCGRTDEATRGFGNRALRRRGSAFLQKVPAKNPKTAAAGRSFGRKNPRELPSAFSAVTTWAKVGKAVISGVLSPSLRTKRMPQEAAVRSVHWVPAEIRPNVSLSSKPPTVPPVGLSNQKSFTIPRTVSSVQAPLRTTSYRLSQPGPTFYPPAPAPWSFQCSNRPLFCQLCRICLSAIYQIRARYFRFLSYRTSAPGSAFPAVRAYGSSGRPPRADSAKKFPSA